MPSLGELSRRVAALPLDVWEETARRLGSEPDGEISVNVSRRGEHNYSYVHVQEAVIDALAESAGRRATLDPRPLELRVDIHKDTCRILGRLTPRPLGERDYCRYRTPAQTDPTLAAAMVRFSYGPRRPLAERWIVGSRNLAVAGISYFGGRRVPRKRLWGAASDLAAAAWPPWR